MSEVPLYSNKCGGRPAGFILDGKYEASGDAAPDPDASTHLRVVHLSGEMSGRFRPPPHTPYSIQRAAYSIHPTPYTLHGCRP